MMTSREPTGEMTVRSEGLADLFQHAGNAENGLDWGHVFSLPIWLNTWWEAFGEGGKTEILSVWEGKDIIGIAPLQIRNLRAMFIGAPDVCDYLDVVVVPGKGPLFFSALLRHLDNAGIDELDFRCLRPESYALADLVPILKDRSIPFDCEPDGVSLEVDLAENWEAYLGGLKSKQRHEVRRKLRRLGEAGEWRFEVQDGAGDITAQQEVFFRLFEESRTDKTEFMTPKMKRFFSGMISAMAGAGLLKFGGLYLDGAPAAVVLYFDYQNRIYLYNNGYDPRFRDVGVGLMSKILLLKQSIYGKKDVFDFLKGPETYKYRLGGRETALSRLKIRL